MVERKCVLDYLWWVPGTHGDVHNQSVGPSSGLETASEEIYGFHKVLGKCSEKPQMLDILL